jgi:predicted NAD-dependent protein-ADP-ribosyltransferase YbiA (DUF1768 family)
VGGNSIMGEIIDIGSSSKSELGRKLSNWTDYPFEFDGVKCRCIESLLQAFKFPNIKEQVESCGRRGYWAQRIGHNGDGWKKNQILFWNGKEYKRDSKEYQDLLDRLFRACYTNNDKAKIALLETGDAIFIHSRGKTDIKDTVLTAEEFIIRLETIRKELQDNAKVTNKN